MQTPDGFSAVDTELVANYVEQHLLTDAESIQRVVRQNRTLGHRILQFINGLLGKIGFKSAKERAFLLRARTLYNAALNETQSSFRRELQQKYDAQNSSLDTVRERYESGELSEAEAAAEHDRLFDPELYMEQRSGGGELQNSFVGTDENGIEIYETTEDVKKLPRKEKMQLFQSLMEQEFRGRTAKFTDGNGDVHYAAFDAGDVRKNIYGDKKSSAAGWRAKINTGADGSIFELVENAEYLGSGAETGKATKAHRNVFGWDYYVKTVQIDGKLFRVLANIRKKPNGEFVYSIQLNESKKKASAPLLGSEQQKTADGPYDRALTDTNDSIAQNQNIVNGENTGIEKWSVQYSISPRLEDDFVSVVKGTFDKNSEVTIGTTSDFLTNTLGVQALPVTMPANKAYSAIVTEARAKADGRYRAGTNYHGLGVHGLALALEASEDPIAAFVSKPDANSKRLNAVVLVTKEIQRGKNIVVVEAIDTEGFQNEKYLNVNKIVTAYDRAAVLRDIVDASNDGRLLHLDKKRSQQILAGSNASNSRSTIQRINTDFSNSIANFRENVKWKKQGKQSFSAEAPTATKTPMQLAMEQAQQKAEQDGRQNSYSPKTPEEKRDIAGAFRQFLNGEIDTETLRKRIGTDKIGTVPDGREGAGSDLSHLSGTDLAAARLVQQAHRDGISVDEYLRQNAEHCHVCCFFKNCAQFVTNQNEKPLIFKGFSFWRRDRDSNPSWGISPNTISSRAP